MQPLKLGVRLPTDGRIVWQSVRENELIQFIPSLESYASYAYLYHTYLPCLTIPTCHALPCLPGIVVYILPVIIFVPPTGRISPACLLPPLSQDGQSVPV